MRGSENLDTSLLAARADWLKGEPAAMNPKITFLESVFNTDACQPITVREVIEGIRSGRWPDVLKVRCLFKSEAKSARYKKAKEQLPAAIFAGEFSRASDAGLVQHSGLAVVDYDELGKRLNDIRQRAICHPSVFAVFLSPSGDGLKIVFRIRVAADAEDHKATFQQLKRYAADFFGVAPDKTPDVSRKCFVSFDPEAYLNENAAEWLAEPTSAPLLTALQHHGVTHCSIPELHAVPTLGLLPNNSTAGKEDALSFDWLSNGFIPNRPKQNNDLMLKIARHLLDVRQQIGRTLTIPETGRLIQRWFDLTPPEFRSHPVGHYHEELFRAIGNAKVPLSQTPVQFAVAGAKSHPWPPWIRELPGEELRLIAAVCVELQSIAGAKAFFLSSYDLGEALGIPQRTAHAKLAALRGTPYLKLVRCGNQALSNEYLLTPPAQ